MWSIDDRNGRRLLKSNRNLDQISNKDLLLKIIQELPTIKSTIDYKAGFS